MAKVAIEIDSCRECKYCKQERELTADAFELVHSYKCLMADKTIKSYVDWSDSIGEIPGWCPLRIKDTDDKPNSAEAAKIISDLEKYIVKLKSLYIGDNT
ncbi:MAG: hypothetical protein IJ593_09200 [Lachnospiraceae bacterium]|nr:hypothetical protein [Lachnospiraceae bacterium]